jgi:hypothetical protein
MSEEETANWLTSCSVPSKSLFYILRKDSIPIGMSVSKGENADEMACATMRRRRFFFMTGKG